jgi:GTP cyclohydrolase I
MSQLTDTQSEPDHRGLPIDRVGIRGLRYPVTIDGVPTVGTFAMTVDLPATQRGTHMSRFVEVLASCHHDLNEQSFLTMARTLRSRLNSTRSCVELAAPWFVEKLAPVSGGAAMLDYELHWLAEVNGRTAEFTQTVRIPVGTLCPCSKAISERGAHNQRGVVSVSLRRSKPVATAELIRLAEAAASSDLYSLLKRSDEKFITERAYDNPVFVEDLVRSIAEQVRSVPGLHWYRVEAENLESIHNHNAYAMIEGAGKSAKKRRPAG